MCVAEALASSMHHSVTVRLHLVGIFKRSSHHRLTPPPHPLWVLLYAHHIELAVLRYRLLPRGGRR